MTNEIDLAKMNLNELKALGYDLTEQLNYTSRVLSQVKQKIEALKKDPTILVLEEVTDKKPKNK
mgnify:CR=1 FL=1